MRPPRAFGMKLRGENFQVGNAQSFDAIVVEIEMRDFDVRRERRRAHGETVIVRGNFDAVGDQIFYRLICAAMSELQFVRFAAEREPKICCPRQIPKIGLRPNNARTFSIAYVTAAGSPGPFDKKMPSGFNAKTSSAE